MHSINHAEAFLNERPALVCDSLCVLLLEVLRTSYNKILSDSLWSSSVDFFFFDVATRILKILWDYKKDSLAQLFHFWGFFAVPAAIHWDFVRILAHSEAILYHFQCNFMGILMSCLTSIRFSEFLGLCPRRLAFFDIIQPPHWGFYDPQRFFEVLYDSSTNSISQRLPKILMEINTHKRKR